MPNVAGSLDKLEPLESANAELHGDFMPLVVHPNEQFLGNRPIRKPINYKQIRDSGNHGPLLYQPTVEVLDRWRVLNRNDAKSTAEDMLEVQERLGFHHIGVALDLHHLQAKRGKYEALNLDWCIKFAGELAALGALEYPGEVQMSFRPDFGGDQSHLAMAVNGALPDTPHGQIFKNIVDEMPSWQRTLRVTTEVLADLFNKQEINLSYIQGNRRLIEAIARMAISGTSA